MGRIGSLPSATEGYREQDCRYRALAAQLGFLAFRSHAAVCEVSESPAIPKGLCPPAQGCESYPGQTEWTIGQPQRGFGNQRRPLWDLHRSAECTKSREIDSLRVNESAILRIIKIF